MESFWSRERRPRRRVLVAVSLDPRGALALRRATVMAKRFRAGLHLVHVLPRSSSHLVENSTIMRDVIRRWGEREGVVELLPDNIHLAAGPAALQIENVASSVGAQLVVLGASPTSGQGTTLALAAFMSRAVLIANDHHVNGDILAATDLETPGFPIVHTAIELAFVLGRGVTIVHNLGSRRGSPTRGVAERMDDLQSLASGLPAIQSASVSTLGSAAEAVDHVARTRNADIVVVGVRPGRGHTLAGVLQRERGRSVLAVPIAKESA